MTTEFAHKVKEENSEVRVLRNFKRMAENLIAESREGVPVLPERVKAILDLGEEFGLVSRQGMATGLHYPLREEKYLNAGRPVDADIVIPTLKHIMKQAQRAYNIETRAGDSGHRPRDRKPLYGRAHNFSDNLNYK